MGIAGWFALRDSDWAAKMSAASRYNMPSQEVEVLSRPHDCDFMTAPTVSKHCHYERQYLIEWFTLDKNNRPMGYGNLQEQPPTECSETITDFSHRCHYLDQLKPDQHPVANEWRPRHVEVHWRKVEE